MQLLRNKQIFKFSQIFMDSVSTYQRYTFIQMDIERSIQFLSLPKYRKIDSFQKMLVLMNSKHFNTTLQQLKSINITEKHLNLLKRQNNKTFIKSNQSSSENFFIQNAKFINDLSQSYINIKQDIMRLLQLKELPNLLKIVSSLNLLHTQLWFNILRLIDLNYENLQMKQKILFLMKMKSYIDRFQTNKNYNGSRKSNQMNENQNKFLFKIKCLNDFINQKILREKLFNVKQYQIMISKYTYYNYQRLKNPQSTQLRLKVEIFKEQMIQLLKLKFDLMLKLNKTNIIDKYEFKTMHQPYVAKILQIIQNCQTQSINITVFLNFFLNFQFNIPYGFIQKCLTPKLFENIENKSQKNKQQLIKKVLTIYSFYGKYSDQIFDNYIIPELKNKLNSIEQANKLEIFNNIAYLLLKSCIFENKNKKKKIISLIIQIINVCNKYSVVQNGSMHLTKHYLTLNNFIQVSSKQSISFCQKLQIPEIVNLMNTNVKKVYPCLISKKKQLNIQEKYQQSSPSQQFWKNIYKYVLQDYVVFYNATICQYQIDIVALKDQNIIAIEIEGNNHKRYNIQIKNSQNCFQIKEAHQDQLPRQYIRKKILTHYNVKFIKIKCFEEQVQNMMKKNQYYKAKQYAKQLLSKCLRQKLKVHKND